MVFSFSQSAHQSACAWKQKELESKLSSLPPEYSSPSPSPSPSSSPALTPDEQKIHSLPLTALVAQCRAGHISPMDIMRAYGKKTVEAHRKTNCVTDVMFEEALGIAGVRNWSPAVRTTTALVGAEEDGNADAEGGAGLDASVQDVNGELVLGPGTKGLTLLGVPVSIKDTIDIEGHDTTIGFSRNVDKPVPTSSSIVRLLKDLGCLIHAKTTVPTGLLAIETHSDIYGTTSNPYNPLFTSGGSTGGGAALVAMGGARIEIGTDIGGSVRIPAHFCGIWSLKGSAGRFPVWGSWSSMVGLEGVPIVASPMAGRLDDLKEFWERVVDAEPWQYDHTCIPLPWRQVNIREEGRKLKWGVMWDDGIIPPTPACRRALQLVVNALRKQGHEVVDFQPPNILEGLKIGYQLVFSDGGDQLRSSLSPSESLTPPATSLLSLLSLPKPLLSLLAVLARSPFTSLGGNDPLSAQLCSILHRKKVVEQRALVGRREEYKEEWGRRWREEGVDFVLTVPFPTPAVEHGMSEKTTLLSAAYTFIFSILDYTAGILPVTHVDKSIDAFPSPPSSSLPPNSNNTTASSNPFPYPPLPPTLPPVAHATYSVYDPVKMHGLPLGVQVVGRRLEEEKVLEGMRVVEDALREMGVVFRGLGDRERGGGE